MTLDEARAIARKMVDENTASLIVSNPMTFDGNNFSMSLQAQINWLGINQIPDAYFPYNIKTTANTFYSLSAVNKLPFFLTAVGTKNGWLQSGNDLIAQIDALTTVDECLIFIDPRV